MIAAANKRKKEEKQGLETKEKNSTQGLKREEKLNKEREKIQWSSGEKGDAVNKKSKSQTRLIDL